MHKINCAMTKILKFSVLIMVILGFYSCKPKAGDEDVKTEVMSKDYREHLIDSFRRLDSVRKIKDSLFRKAPNTTIKFKEDLFDFGNITAGDIVSHIFVFYNTGKNPLIINSAMGSCGCTVPSYPDQPVAPGDSAEMKVVFSSEGKSGPTTKSITIVANTEPQISELNITSNIGKKKKKDK